MMNKLFVKTVCKTCDRNLIYAEVIEGHVECLKCRNLKEDQEIYIKLLDRACASDLDTRLRHIEHFLYKKYREKFIEL